MAREEILPDLQEGVFTATQLLAIPSTVVLLEDFIVLPHLTVGRRSKAMSQMKTAAEARSSSEILAAIQKVTAQDSELTPLQAAWNAARTELAGRPELRSTDTLADGIVADLYTRIENATRTFKAGSTPALEAPKLLHRTFPKKLAGVTKIPFEEQLVEMDRLIAAFKGPESAWVEVYELKGLLGRLEEAVEEYRKGVHAPFKAAIAHKNVVAARLASHRAMLGVVAKVLANFPGSSDEHVQARSELLGPVLDQIAKQRALRGRKGAIEGEEDVEDIEDDSEVPGATGPDGPFLPPSDS